MTDSNGAYVARLAGSRGYFNINSGSITVFRAFNIGGTDSAAGGDATTLLSGGSLTVTGALRVWNHSKFAWSAGLLSVSSIELNGGGTMSVSDGAAVKLLKAAKIAIDTNNVSRLGLADNDALLTSTNRATVEAYIATARNGGAWNGGGITSANAQSNVSQNTTLGVLIGAEYKLVNGPALDGTNVADADVLIRYTLYGDTDFNRTVNFDDYARIDSGFNNGPSGWLNGDFDLNGVVNFDDYALIDLAFNTQLASQAQLVPEPAGNAVPFSVIALVTRVTYRSRQRIRRRAFL
jgi:hypothetical protein